MIVDPTNREDFSRFLVHLTRDTSSGKAMDNLVNILKEKTIEARNCPCLFTHLIKDSGLSSLLKAKFNSVCLTEVPLTQIKYLVQEIPNRHIKLKPYGLVFWKDDLIKAGANPAIYINAKGTELNQYLLEQFKERFSESKKYSTLKQKENHPNELIQYFSLINIINDNHDFAWEREWRYSGDYCFKYRNIVAIIAENSNEFFEKCKEEINPKELSYVKKIPIISSSWGYEEVIEQLSFALWNK